MSYDPLITPVRAELVEALSFSLQRKEKEVLRQAQDERLEGFQPMGDFSKLGGEVKACNTGEAAIGWKPR